MAGIVYFLSDTHFNHEKIYSLRGFSSIDEHDNSVADSISKELRSRDTLVLLGDISFTVNFDLNQKLLESYNRVHGCSCTKLPYFIKIVQGNHDKASRLNKLVNNGVINSYQALLEFKYGGVNFVATHVPVHPDCLTRWKFNLHGHTHDIDIGSAKYINVSWEKFNRPISINDVIKIFKANYETY